MWSRSYWQRAEVAPLDDENPYRAGMMGGASQSAGWSPAAAMSLAHPQAQPVPHQHFAVHPHREPARR
jgi:hypothetical protein